MKKIFGFLLLASTMIACKKDTLSQTQDAITGKWELRKTLGIGPISYAPGNQNLLLLNAQHGYEFWKHDTLINKGTYALLKKRDCGATVDEPAIRFSQGNNTTELFLYVNKDTLSIAMGKCVADGGGAIYVRVP